MARLPAPLLDALPVPLALLDARARILHANPAFARLTRARKRMSAFRLLGREGQAWLRSSLANPKENGAAVHDGSRLIRIDEASSVLILAPSEGTEELPIPSLVIDARGRIVRGNASAAKLLGQPKDGLRGRRIGDFLEVPRRREGGRPGAGGVQDVRVLTASKEPLRQVSFAIPGGPHRLVLLLGDRERSDAIRGKERVLAERKTFLQSIAHDLRAPLASASGYVSLLRRNEKADDPTSDRKYFMDRLQAVLNQVDEMLQHLVELNRVGAAKRASRRVPMVPLVQKVVERFAPRIMEVRAQITVAPDLPDVWGDEIQVSRVIQNLVDNALKFRAARPLRIEVAFAAAARAGAFVVRDNGLGIPSALQPRIWEPFVKLDPSQPGSGVGLSLIQRIVEEHGGRIWVESTAGRGAAFFVELPLAPPSRRR